MAEALKPIKLSFADRRMLEQLARLRGTTSSRVLARLIRDAYAKRAKAIKKRAKVTFTTRTGAKKTVKRKIRRKTKGLLVAKPPRPTPKKPATAAAGAKKAPVSKKAAAKKAVAKKAPASKKAVARKAPASKRAVAKKAPASQLVAKPPPKPKT